MPKSTGNSSTFIDKVYVTKNEGEAEADNKSKKDDALVDDINYVFPDAELMEEKLVAVRRCGRQRKRIVIKNDCRPKFVADHCEQLMRYEAMCKATSISPSRTYAPGGFLGSELRGGGISAQAGNGFDFFCRQVFRARPLSLQPPVK